MLMELHCHTREHSPCSRVAAGALAAAIRNRGADGLVITDHHYLWPAEELAELRRESRLPDDFLLLSGQEVLTADFGDVLVYGADRSISPGMTSSDLRRSYPEAALVWAHPYRYGHLPTAVELMNTDFNAIEIVNPHHSEEENRRAVADWKRWGYRATSGSDIHRLDFADFHPVWFDCPIKDMNDLVSCMKDGQFSPRIGRYTLQP
ncbi:PHP domain-containing protein [Geotalea sp. SG265]|uniref:PHP domain-containing protein n=1 Tax=Geotalea sp. SG265 TaxID=2922867 RepID=UPI001FB02341|nr:PHP domain-containing protein [Geotalea sp. SG265]